MMVRTLGLVFWIAQLVWSVALAQDAESPSTPGNFTAIASSSTGVIVNWNVSTDNVGVTGYQLERCLGSGCNSSFTVFEISSTGWANSGLTPSTTYGYRVRAKDAVPNYSAFTSIVYVTTKAAGDTQAPTTPGNLTAVASSSTAVVVNWNASTDNVGVTGYQLERCQGSGCSSSFTLFELSSAGWANSGLAPSTTYGYRVRAKDAVPNYSAFTGVVYVTTQAAGDAQAPTTPTNFSAVPSSSTTAVLNWSASTDNVGVVGYQVERCQGTGCNSSFTPFNSSNAGWVNTGLAPATTYGYRVRAMDAVPNYSAFTAIVYVTTQSGSGDAQAPTTPTNLSATASSSTTAVLNWSASTDNVSVVGYQVERCQGTGCNSSFTPFNSSSAGWVNTGLAPSTTYGYRVRARDAVPNYSAFTNIVYVTTQSGSSTDAQAPTTPANLLATAGANAQVSVAWGAATDNVGVTGYEVERCQGSGCSSAFTQFNSATAGWVNAGVAASTTYGYRVRARDAVPNYSVFTSIVYVTTPAAGDRQRVQEFEYDEMARLQKVVSPERDVSYTLDPAGNRITLDSAQGRGWPTSIEVPALSQTGDYTIRWGASTGSGTRFELHEANNPGFAGADRIYNDTGLVRPITGKPDGTYYYRVRSCDPQGCGPHRAGANPIVVARPPVPSVPANLYVPEGDIDGSYPIAWTASSGTVTAYELYEAVDGGAFGASPVYSGGPGITTASITGRGNGTYSYQVRACNTPYSCSAPRNGSNPVWVTLPPSTPGAVSVPAYSNTGNYTVSWGRPPEQMTRFELLESTAAGEVLIYQENNTSFARSGKPDGVNSYRVRACNGPACSAYTSERGTAAVIYIDRIAPTPPTSVGMLGNGYSLSWSGGSTDSAGSGAGSGRDHWNIYRNGSLIGSSTIWTFDDTSQPGNVTLNYVVRTVDRAGNESGPSPTYSVFVDTIPPTTPNNFRATSVTINSVSLAWDASSDAFGISRYEISRTPGTTWQTYDASTAYVDDTVSSGMTYTYRIVAMDGHSVRSAPASISVTTPAGAPSVPAMNNPGFQVIAARDYTISWQPSTGSVAYYIVEEQTQTAPLPPWDPTTVTGTSKGYSHGGGNYKYRVKACTSANVCSGYSAIRDIEVCIGGCSD